MRQIRNFFNLYCGSLGQQLARIPYPHFLIAIIFSVISAPAATVNCTNNSGDAGMIQSAVNSGGSVTINGTCAMGTATVSILNAVAITGTATLNGTGSTIFAVWSNNVSINGLTFNGTTATTVNGSDGSINQYFIFTNNTVQNTNGNDGLVLGPIMQYAAINNNKFFNIAPNGFSSFIFNGYCYSTSAGCDIPGTGIGGLNGWDQSTIEYNTFDLIADDGIHIAWNDISQDRFYFLTKNVSVSYNTFTRVHRISLETQGTTNWTPCNAGTTNVPSNCTDSSHLFCSSFKVAGNYAHNFFQTYVNTYAFSLPTTNDQQYINNSAIAENPNVANNSSLAYAQETAGHNTLIQGNVYASDYFNAQNPHGWSNGILFGGSSPLGGLATVQNNYLCMDQDSSTDFNQENPTGNPYAAAIQYNFRANSCPNTGHLATSSIVPSYIGSSTAAGSMTFNFGVVSTLSIRNVQFFLDSATTPVATQEVSDVSSTFATDTTWLYHVTLDTTSLASGSHALVALVTDVSGATNSLSESFSIGGTGTGTPTAQLTPSSLLFGSQTVQIASSAQTFTLKNSGTAPLSIGGISVNGSNSPDFAGTSNCGTTLAASASCTISVVFTPSVSAQETASLSVADNAAGSPQTGSLSGTGVAPAPVPTPVPTPVGSPLPTTLPKGMILWLANNTGVVASGPAVSIWEDQSGNANNAAQSTAANMPTLVSGNNGQQALHFNGASTFMSISSLPIDGLTGMTVFLVSSSGADTAAGYGAYAFLNWPETAYWGQTFFATYQSFSEFRFGTTQIGNENHVPMVFNRTGSFGLNEWLHSGSTDSMFINGHAVAVIPGKSTTIAGVGSAVILGENGTTYYQGDVSEVIVYSRALSAAERQTVEQYLMSKYHL